MAYDASQVDEIRADAVYTFQVQIAKWKKSKDRTDTKGQPAGGHWGILLGLRVVEGEAIGAQLWHNLWLVHGQNPVQSRMWGADVARDIKKMLGDSFNGPLNVPEFVGEETDLIEYLPGATFEALTKLSKGSGGYSDSINIAKILGAVDLGSIPTSGFGQEIDPDDVI